MGSPRAALLVLGEEGKLPSLHWGREVTQLRRAAGRPGWVSPGPRQDPAMVTCPGPGSQGGGVSTTPREAGDLHYLRR